MPIQVITQTSREVLNEQELNYQKFRKYYDNTDLLVKEIYALIGFTNQRCAGVRYIRSRMKEDGLNSDKRVQSIRRGEWL